MAGIRGSRTGGRNAKPRQLHVLKGSYRADRHAGKMTPEAPPGRPVSPKPLTGDALEEWDRMTARLELLGALSPVHDAALYQHCRLFAETEDQARRGEEYSASIAILESNLRDLEGADLLHCFQEITKMHSLRARNESKVRQGRMALRQYLVEFGVTPAAISRVSVGKPGGTADSEDAVLARLLSIK